ncbi:hypothetical protein M422DRAFT_270461 [Sphaerobolus stellatus SS14]|uniref:Unplaced genomic scaffold SPHSTscaffold_236, whole genome shotgun sequence n=1 Tax=Sphaerobolus stellatus (strain SS14) TaxID=990650 RepID=A0A0C9TFR2_SPHS4|nr:hypothetical protein M422DRAFT_270461 [Sphaerobolus stellatus SS14]
MSYYLSPYPDDVTVILVSNDGNEVRVHGENLATHAPLYYNALASLIQVEVKHFFVAASTGSLQYLRAAMYPLTASQAGLPSLTLPVGLELYKLCGSIQAFGIRAHVERYLLNELEEHNAESIFAVVSEADESSSILLQTASQYLLRPVHQQDPFYTGMNTKGRFMLVSSLISSRISSFS